MSDTDALIAKALANAPGGPLRARSIRRVDAHLVGHAKAVLVSRGAVFRRTHDLEELGHLLVSRGIDPPMPPETLAMLNPFAVTRRYLDQETEHISIDDVEDMLKTIEHWIGATVSTGRLE